MKRLKRLDRGSGGRGKLVEIERLQQPHDPTDAGTSEVVNASMQKKRRCGKENGNHKNKGVNTNPHTRKNSFLHSCRENQRSAATRKFARREGSHNRRDVTESRKKGMKENPNGLGEARNGSWGKVANFLLETVTGRKSYLAKGNKKIKRMEKKNIDKKRANSMAGKRNGKEEGLKMGEGHKER